MKDRADLPSHYTWGEGCEGWHLLKSGSLSVIRERMPAGTEDVLHIHRHAQQVFYILAGTASFEIDGKESRVPAGESVHIPAKTLHRISNRESQHLEFLVVSEPPSHADRVDLLDYTDELKAPVKTLNYEWLEKYFRVEEGDELSLSNPREQIIDKGGFIYYARMNGRIVGTASLLKITDHEFELGKMAVTHDAQGHGIGAMLLVHCLNVARQQSIRRLVLYSNTSLEAALHLYRKHGFTEAAPEPGHYERANIKMEKYLSP